MTILRFDNIDEESNYRSHNIINDYNKIIGIIGSRRRDSLKDFLDIQLNFFKIYSERDIICSGGCPKGGDRFANKIARDFGIPILIYYPNWNKYGKAAGFIRNTKIAEISTVLIACVSDDRTGGTEDTIKKYIKLKPNNKIVLV